MSQAPYSSVYPIDFSPAPSPTLQLMEAARQADMRNELELQKLAYQGQKALKPEDALEANRQQLLSGLQNDALKIRSTDQWANASTYSRKAILDKKRTEYGNLIVQSGLYATEPEERAAALENALLELQGDYNTQQKAVDDVGLIETTARGIGAGVAGLAQTVVNFGVIDTLQDAGAAGAFALGGIMNFFTPGNAAVDQDTDYAYEMSKSVNDLGLMAKEFVTGLGTKLVAAAHNDARYMNTMKVVQEGQARGSETPLLDMMLDWSVPFGDKLHFVTSMTTDSLVRALGLYAIAKHAMTRLPVSAITSKIPGFYPIAGEARQGMMLINPFTRAAMANGMVYAGMAGGALGWQEIWSMAYDTPIEAFQDSDVFKEGLAMGLSPEEAKRRAIDVTATVQGLWSALLNGTVGAFGELFATGVLTARIGTQTMKSLGARIASAIKTGGAVTITEGVTEGLEEASINYNANTMAGQPFRSVGASMAEGAMMGAAMGGFMGIAGGARRIAWPGREPATRAPEHIAAIPEARKAELIEAHQAYFDSGRDASKLAHVTTLTPAEADFMGIVMEFAEQSQNLYTRKTTKKSKEPDKHPVTAELLDELNSFLGLNPEEQMKARQDWSAEQRASMADALSALNAGTLETNPDETPYEGKKVPLALDSNRVTELANAYAADPNADFKPRSFLERRVLHHLANPAASQKHGLSAETAAILDGVIHNYLINTNEGATDRINYTSDPGSAAYFDEQLSVLAGPEAGQQDFGLNGNIALKAFAKLKQPMRKAIIDAIDNKKSLPADPEAQMFLRNYRYLLNQGQLAEDQNGAFTLALKALAAQADPRAQPTPADPRAGFFDFPHAVTQDDVDKASQLAREIDAELTAQAGNINSMDGAWVLASGYAVEHGYTFIQRQLALYQLGYLAPPANFSGPVEQVAFLENLAYVFLYGPDAQRNEVIAMITSLNQESRDYVDSLTTVDPQTQTLQFEVFFPVYSDLLDLIDQMAPDQRPALRALLEGAQVPTGPFTQAANIAFAINNMREVPGRVGTLKRMALEKLSQTDTPGGPAPAVVQIQPMNSQDAKTKLASWKAKVNAELQVSPKSNANQSDTDYHIEVIEKFAEANGLTRVEKQALKHAFNLLDKGAYGALGPANLGYADALIYEIHFGDPRNREAYQEQFDNFTANSQSVRSLDLMRQYAEWRLTSKDFRFLFPTVDEFLLILRGMNADERASFKLLLKAPESAQISQILNYDKGPFHKPTQLFKEYRRLIEYATDDVKAQLSEQVATALDAEAAAPIADPVYDMRLHEGKPAVPTRIEAHEDVASIKALPESQRTWTQTRFVHYMEGVPPGKQRLTKKNVQAADALDEKQQAFVDTIIYDLLAQSGQGVNQARIASLESQHKLTKDEFAYLKEYWELLRPKNADEYIQSVEAKFGNDQQRYNALMAMINNTQNQEQIANLTPEVRDFFTSFHNSVYHLTKPQQNAFRKQVSDALGNRKVSMPDHVPVGTVPGSNGQNGVEYYSQQSPQSTNPEAYDDGNFIFNIPDRSQNEFYSYDLTSGQWAVQTLDPQSGSLVPAQAANLDQATLALLSNSRLRALLDNFFYLRNKPDVGFHASAPAIATGMQLATPNAATPIQSIISGRSVTNVAIRTESGLFDIIEIHGPEAMGSGKATGLRYVYSSSAKGWIRYAYSEALDGATGRVTYRGKDNKAFLKSENPAISEYMANMITGYMNSLTPLSPGQNINLSDPNGGPGPDGPNGGAWLEAPAVEIAPDSETLKVENAIRNENAKGSREGQTTPGASPQVSERVETNPQGIGDEAGGEGAQATPGSGEASEGAGDVGSGAQAAGAPQADAADNRADAGARQSDNGPRRDDARAGQEPAESDGEPVAEASGRDGVAELQARTAEQANRNKPPVSLALRSDEELHEDRTVARLQQDLNDITEAVQKIRDRLSQTRVPPREYLDDTFDDAQRQLLNLKDSFEQITRSLPPNISNRILSETSNFNAEFQDTLDTTDQLRDQYSYNMLYDETNSKLNSLISGSSIDEVASFRNIVSQNPLSKALQNLPENILLGALQTILETQAGKDFQAIHNLTEQNLFELARYIASDIQIFPSTFDINLVTKTELQNFISSAISNSENLFHEFETTYNDLNNLKTEVKSIRDVSSILNVVNKYRKYMGRMNEETTANNELRISYDNQNLHKFGTKLTNQLQTEFNTLIEDIIFYPPAGTELNQQQSDALEQGEYKRLHDQIDALFANSPDGVEKTQAKKASHEFINNILLEIKSVLSHETFNQVTINPQKAALLLNVRLAEFSGDNLPTANGLADPYGIFNIYINQNITNDPTAVYSYLAHEALHILTGLTIKLEARQSTTPSYALFLADKFKQALNLSDLIALPDNSDPYFGQPIEQLSWSLQDFLVNLPSVINYNSGLDSLKNLVISYTNPFIVSLRNTQSKGAKTSGTQVENLFASLFTGATYAEFLRSAGQTHNSSGTSRSLAGLHFGRSPARERNSRQRSPADSGQLRETEAPPDELSGRGVHVLESQKQKPDAGRHGESGVLGQTGRRALAAPQRATLHPGDQGDSWASLDPDAGGGGMAGLDGESAYPGGSLRLLPTVNLARQSAGDVIGFPKERQTPLDELLSDPDADPGANTWEDHTANIEAVIKRSRKKLNRPAVAPNLRNAPDVAMKDVVAAAYRLITQDRAKAVARRRPEREEFANRKYNPVTDLEDWHTLGVVLRAKFEDRTAPFRAWAANTVKHITGNKEDIPLLKAYSLYPGLKNAAFTRLLDKSLLPVNKWIRQQARSKGLNEEEILTLADQVATHYHVLTEGSRVFEEEMYGELKAAQGRAAKYEGRDLSGLSDKEASAVLKARENLFALETSFRLYRAYQETGQSVRLTAEEAEALSGLEDANYQEGQEYVPKVAGGVADVHRREAWRKLQEVFTEKELMEIKDVTVRGFQVIVEELLEAKVLSPEDVAAWPVFAAHVPLNVQRNKSATQGVYPGSYIFNPRRFDYSRQGSRTPAAGAIYNLYNAVDLAAEVIGRRDFDRELHRHYEFLKSSGQPGRFGLKRVRMNNDETGVIGKGADDAYALSAPGWVVRVREGDSGRANSYKYYFNFRDQAETEIMNKAIANTAVANLGLRMLTEANRLHSSFLTRYNASFSPGAMVKDLIERFFNQYSRDRFVRADGSSVSGVEVARRMASLAVNPEFYSAYFKAFVKGEESDTPFGKLVAEFRRSGANFNQLSLIKSLGIETTSANVKAQLLERKRLKIAWNKFAGSTPVKAVNKVFDGWNDGFNGFAPALQFAAMRLSGMTFKDSAADTLDMMNYYKTGEMDSMGSAFFVFYRPIVQGGANFLRSISPFGKGDDAAKWRGAVTFAVLVTMGILAQGLLRSLGDIDDETGINSYDALPFETVSRSMAITLPGGGIFKAPIGFGGPQAAFGMGAAIHRMGLGLLTPRQALSHSAVAFMKQVAPDVYPGYAVSDNPFAFGAQTFVPQIFRPVIDLAVNKNYFGGPIKRGAATVGIREYDKGKLATAPGWHEFARTAFETTNLDFTPEQWRYLLTSYLWGPLAAFTSSYDEDKLLPNEYGSGATNRIFSAFGLNAFYKPETDSALNYIYLVKERFEQDFLRTGTRISRTGESSTHDEKIDLIRDNMKEAGYSADEIKGYLFVAEFDKEKDGISRDFSQLASKYKYGDIEVEGSVQRKFQKFADAQAKLIERTGEKLWALDLLRDGVGKGARKPEKDK